jgi:hypothetical protein
LCKLNTYDSNAISEDLGGWYVGGKVKEGGTVANATRDKIGEVRHVKNNVVEVVWNGKREKSKVRP